MTIALTREVSPAIVRCELTHVAREPIDLDRARAQHRRYEAALEAAGCTIVRLPADPELPDSVFVEDVAIVTDEVAILTRPGAASRRPEIPAVAAALSRYRPVVAIEGEATLDGGDVLRIGRTVFVGQSRRTNELGLRQLGAILEPLGYRTVAVPLERCLHLKSAVTQVAEGVVLLNGEWVDTQAFAAYERIEIDPSEPYAANALRVGNTLVFPSAYPRTCKRLEARGIPVAAVDVSELIKAEGAVTCCSLVFAEA
jgi:dimethylargininase